MPVFPTLERWEQDQEARSTGLNKNAASENKTKLTDTPIYKPIKCLSGHYRKYTLAWVLFIIPRPILQELQHKPCFQNFTAFLCFHSMRPSHFLEYDHYLPSIHSDREPF